MGAYVKKTNRRRQEERRLSVRSERHEPADYQKLTELLIRLSLSQSGPPPEKPPARSGRRQTPASSLT